MLQKRKKFLDTPTPHVFLSSVNGWRDGFFEKSRGLTNKNANFLMSVCFCLTWVVSKILIQTCHASPNLPLFFSRIKWAPWILERKKDNKQNPPDPVNYRTKYHHGASRAEGGMAWNQISFRERPAEIEHAKIDNAMRGSFNARHISGPYFFFKKIDTFILTNITNPSFVEPCFPLFIIWVLPCLFKYPFPM